MLRGSSSNVLSYSVEIPSWMRNLAENLEALNKSLINELLPRVWSEEIIDAISAYGLKNNDEYSKPAYKFFEQELRLNNPWNIDLPSRYRRALLEQVGMILRSQKKRKDLFHIVKTIFHECYERGEEDGRRRKRLTYKNAVRKLLDNGYKFNYILLRQVVFQMCNYYEEYGGLPEKYTGMVAPKVESGSLTLMPDDGQMFRLRMRVRDKRLRLTIEVKLPLSKDGARWKWFTFSVEPYERFKEMLSQAHGIHKPVFVPRRRKSGMKDYELILPLSFKNKKNESGDRILSVDLGERNLAVLVVIDKKYRQLTPPVFVKPRMWNKMRALKVEMDGLRSKIGGGLDYDGRLKAQFIRLQKKLNRMRDVLVDEVSSIIVKVALVYGCGTIVMEDLRSYQPDGKKGLLNWLLSNWRRGDLPSHIEYTAKMYGVRVERVPPNDTSKRCPRCGSYGVHIKSPRHPIMDAKYSFFKCPCCGFMGDRDYVGALNVGRCFLAGGKRESLGMAKPLTYMVGASPLGNRSPGGMMNLTQVSVSAKKSVTALLMSMRLLPMITNVYEKKER